MKHKLIITIFSVIIIILIILNLTLNRDKPPSSPTQPTPPPPPPPPSSTINSQQPISGVQHQLAPNVQVNFSIPAQTWPQELPIYEFPQLPIGQIEATTIANSYGFDSAPVLINDSSGTIFNWRTPNQAALNIQTENSLVSYKKLTTPPLDVTTLPASLDADIQTSITKHLNTSNISYSLSSTTYTNTNDPHGIEDNPQYANLIEQTYKLLINQSYPLFLNIRNQPSLIIQISQEGIHSITTPHLLSISQIETQPTLDFTAFSQRAQGLDMSLVEIKGQDYIDPSITFKTINIQSVNIIYVLEPETKNVTPHFQVQASGIGMNGDMSYQLIYLMNMQ